MMAVEVTERVSGPSESGFVRTLNHALTSSKSDKVNPVHAIRLFLKSH
jgi:hypothetical protein